VIVVVTLIPVLVFLLLLFLLDSFKLVRISVLTIAFAAGIGSALLSLVINLLLLSAFSNVENYSLYISPIIEEVFKSLIIIFLIKKSKIGFLIDAGIIGFAVGAGFASAENIYYLSVVADQNLLLWIFRGLGTAMMHSGTTSILAIILTAALNREKNIITGYIPGLLLAIAIHSGFNHFYIQPAIQTILVTIVVVTLLVSIFSISKLKLQNWLELELHSEAELLISIDKGKLSSTRAGAYLGSLKKYYPAEIIVDMYCFLKLYLELSIAAKRNILLAENDFPIIAEPDFREKITELDALRKCIGKAGELALSPLVKLNQRNLWKLNSLR